MFLSPQRFMVALALAVAAGGTLWWFTPRAPTTAALPEKHIKPHADGETTAPALAPIPTYIATPIGLPPTDAALRETYPALRRAAAEGNATAACRLAFSLRRCQAVKARQALRRLDDEPGPRIVDGLLPDDPALDAPVAGLIADRLNEFPAHLKADAEAHLADAMANSVVALSSAIHTDDETFCEDAPDVTDDEWRRWLRQSALAGQRDSMTAYASGAKWNGALWAWGKELSSDEPLVDDPAFQAWAREAPSMLDTAIDRGDPAALLIAVRASRRPSMLSAARPLDPRRDAILAAVALRVSGRPDWVSTADLGLSPQDVPAADAEARALYDRAFSGSTEGLWRSKSARVGMSDQVGGRIGLAECER